MKYTTYIWREKRIDFEVYDHAAGCRVMAPLKEYGSKPTVGYYAGMTSQHIEARLVTPRRGLFRYDVEVIWSKTYDNLKDASSVENKCISLLGAKCGAGRYEHIENGHASGLNTNRNLRGQHSDYWSKSILKDVDKVEKIINKALAQTAVDVLERHKTYSQELIEKTQKKVFEDIEKNAERLAKDSKVIQDMLAQYIKEHQTPKAKRAKTKSQWNIVNMKKAIKTLEQTLSAYKANKLATTT
jgi:hypothetical protein